MVSREDIRKYFSRYFLGRVPVGSLSLSGREIGVLSSAREVEVHKGAVKARVVSPLRFACGELACESAGLMLKSMSAKVIGGRIQGYGHGDIKAEKVPLKLPVRMQKWLKRFAALPQERRNRLSFIPSGERVTNRNEFNLAYFQPIIHDNVVKLILNKQNGSLFIWYDQISRYFEPKGLYMYKRLGDKDVDWRWVDTRRKPKSGHVAYPAKPRTGDRLQPTVSPRSGAQR